MGVVIQNLMQIEVALVSFFLAKGVVYMPRGRLSFMDTHLSHVFSTGIIWCIVQPLLCMYSLFLRLSMFPEGAYRSKNGRGPQPVHVLKIEQVRDDLTTITIPLCESA